MAVGFAAQTAAALDATWTAQIRGAIVLAAENIYSEGPGTQGHLARATLAAAVARNPDGFVAAFAAALAAQGIDKTSTDAQVSNGVASVWNLQAGA